MTMPPSAQVGLAPPATLPGAGTPPVKLWKVGTLAYTFAGPVALFSWLLWGDFAWSMKERSVIPIVQLLLEKFQASATLAGLLMTTLPGIIGLFLGPVISVRWGRRIPFLLFSTPFAALAMAGLAFSPQMGGWLHTNPVYRYSFLVSFGISVLALGSGLVLYREFQALGGTATTFPRNNLPWRS